MALVNLNLLNRDSSYFNSNDYYLIYTNLTHYFVTQCHLYNGAWYSNESQNYKMSSVLSLSCAEILNKNVKFKNTSLRGTIKKVIRPDGIGVLWGQGQEYKKYGFPHYWNKPENLEIL